LFHNKPNGRFNNLITHYRYLNMKKTLLLAGLCLFAWLAAAQQPARLSLDSCYALALKQYPLLKQRALIARDRDYALDNLSKSIWPQLNVSGQAAYQSDVTSIPIHLPGLDIKTPPKDQYKVYSEVSESLTDWITLPKQKQLQAVNNDLQRANLETELFKLKDRVNQLFFNILLTDERLVQNDISRKDIDAGIERVQSGIRNGTDYQNSLDKLKAELLKNRQKTIDLEGQRQAYANMLGLLIGRDLGRNITLESPAPPPPSQILHRPEMLAFDLKTSTYAIQNSLLDQRFIPKVSVFFQGGVGRPSPLNLISTDWSGYWLAGLKVNWSLNGLYTLKNERQQLDLGRLMNTAQQETFVFNTNYALRQQNDEVSKLQQLIASDDEMVSLRISVKKTAKVQLDNGIVTVSDYVREVDAEDLARQDRALHQIQLLLAQYNYQNSLGN
jgi:outer membrane protein TolC